MLDSIIGRFAENPSLGLVFPDDLHLSDWGWNLQTATELAHRMGIADPLPPLFNFPIEAMFWARVDALKPLFDLKLSWADYPTEPVAIDGTVLHAIERLLPFVARHDGFNYATTHIPGVTW
jgi:lipopolysaccharide biosynthesis protein